MAVGDAFITEHGIACMLCNTSLRINERIVVVGYPTQSRVEVQRENNGGRHIVRATELAKRTRPAVPKGIW